MIKKQRSLKGSLGDATLLSSRGPMDDILDMRFNKAGDSIIAASKNNLYFIKEGSKGGWRNSKGTGWPKNDTQPSISITFNGQDTVTGSNNGRLFVWKGNAYSKSLQHGEKGFIYSLFERPEGKGFLSGSSDGSVVIWDSKYAKANTLKVNEGGIKSLMPKVRSICEAPDGKIIIGTRASEII